MEHFSIEMQTLIDEYCCGQLSLDQLNQKYHEVGTEGHNIMAYRDILEFSKAHSSSIKIYGGFIPRTYAKMLMKEGEEACLKLAIEKDMVPPGTFTIEGSEFHYSMFESMITQRDLYDPETKPVDNFRKMFKA